MLFRPLETERLRLKNISPEDRDFMLAHFSNTVVNRFLFDAEPLSSLREADDVIRFYTQPEPRAQHRWILTRKEDGAKLGTCGFHCWNRREVRCEVGYDFHPDDWRKGYMGEAMREILLFAQNDMKLRQADACIYPENERSLKFAEMLGFVFDGRTKIELLRGRKYEHRIYTLDIAAKDVSKNMS